MPPRVISRLKSIPARYSLVVFVIAVVTLSATFAIEATVIIHSPDLGDVSQSVGYIGKAIPSLVGLIAGLLTIANAIRKTNSDETNNSETTINITDGPADTFYVGGDLYHITTDDVTVGEHGTNVSGTSNEKDNDQTTERQSESESSSTRD